MRYFVLIAVPDCLESDSSKYLLFILLPYIIARHPSFYGSLFYSIDYNHTVQSPHQISHHHHWKSSRLVVSLHNIN